MTTPGPSNGHSRSKRRIRAESNAQRASLLGKKRVLRSQNKTKGGDDPKSRDGGSR